MAIIGKLFFSTFEFDKQWERMGLGDDERSCLENEILDNPRIGRVIQGTGGLRKMRYAVKGKGKSGGARILYVDFVVFERVYLVTAYLKDTKEDISRTEREMFKKLIAQTEAELRGKANE
ncbi:MAG: type II toxin-antitoxin system RelE/ParE family toxin [Oscillospiraceae bacterium]|nr:type II toxin-antitoxin system RelE/ParE family toxin [Oscillospiraceae bacterium]